MLKWTLMHFTYKLICYNANFTVVKCKEISLSTSYITSLTLFVHVVVARMNFYCIA